MPDFISREAALLEIGDADDIMEAERRAWAIPAADVAPVRHGRWIKSSECPEEYDICSVCGKNDKHRSRGNWEHDMVESVPPFCKWCGAKMDGGQDEAPAGPYDLLYEEGGENLR